MRPNRTALKKRAARSIAVGRTIQVLEEGYERTSVAISTDGSGNASGTVAISPAGLFLASRLTGYQALRDQCKILWAEVEYLPNVGTDTEGAVGIYIERDPAAATVASISLIQDQFERQVDRLHRGVKVRWYPQQPTDRVYNALNPGTAALANIFWRVGNSSIVSAGVGYIVATTAFVLRGRP